MKDVTSSCHFSSSLHQNLHLHCISHGFSIVRVINFSIHCKIVLHPVEHPPQTHQLSGFEFFLCPRWNLTSPKVDFSRLCGCSGLLTRTFRSSSGNFANWQCCKLYEEFSKSKLMYNFSRQSGYIF